MEGDDRALVAETRALIEEVESGQTAHAAWVAIQDRVKRLYEGRTQAEVGELIGKKATWVGAVLAWDPGRPELPHARKGAGVERGDKAAAKKVLRDPEARSNVIESLSEEERLELAQAAMEPAMRTEGRRAKERRAVRESRPDRDRTHVELVSLQLDKADIEIIGAIHDARGTTWTAEGSALVENRLEITEARLNLLRAAVTPEGDEIDWDEALAKLETEA